MQKELNSVTFHKWKEQYVGCCPAVLIYCILVITILFVSKH